MEERKKRDYVHKRQPSRCRCRRTRHHPLKKKRRNEKKKEEEEKEETKYKKGGKEPKNENKNMKQQEMDTRTKGNRSYRRAAHQAMLMLPPPLPG